MLHIETNLKRLRETLIGTQSQLAKLVGIGRPEVSHLENGKRKPTYETLCKLEELFDKPHSYLFAEAGKEHQSLESGEYNAHQLGANP